MAHSIRGLLLAGIILLVTLIPGRSQTTKAKTPAEIASGDAANLALQAVDGKDISKGASELRKRFGGIRSAMNVYNPRGRHGIGFGAKGHSIESKLADLSEKALSADQLKTEAEELTKVAHLNLIMADIFKGFAPKKEFLGRGKKEWDRDADDVKAASQTLLKAIKAADAKAVQQAAVQITTACNRCHDGK